MKSYLFAFKYTKLLYTILVLPVQFTSDTPLNK